MPRVVEFTHEGRQYRAEVQPVRDGGPEFAAGAWFVSVDGKAPRRVFEAHADDADGPAFQHRLMIAAWLAEGWDRRVSAERRRSGGRDALIRDRRQAP